MGLRLGANAFPDSSSGMMLAHQLQLREQRWVRTSFLIILISQDRQSRLSKRARDCHYGNQLERERLPKIQTGQALWNMRGEPLIVIRCVCDPSNVETHHGD